MPGPGGGGGGCWQVYCFDPLWFLSNKHFDFLLQQFSLPCVQGFQSVIQSDGGGPGGGGGGEGGWQVYCFDPLWCVSNEHFDTLLQQFSLSGVQGFQSVIQSRLEDSGDFSSDSSSDSSEKVDLHGFAIAAILNPKATKATNKNIYKLIFL